MGLALADAPRLESAPLDERRLRDVSLVRIVRHDNASFLLVAFGAVLLAFALAVWLTGSAPGGRGRPARAVAPEEARAALLATGALMAGLSTLAAARALRIRRVFRVGERAEASVTSVSTAKGYSRVRIDYRHGGESRSLSRSIRRSARAARLRPGDSIAILVDPARPRRLVLAELFHG